MSTEITKVVTAASNMAQYDEKSKRLLSQKSILAHILVKTVDEFKGMKPRDVEKYIEGEPYVGQVPVDPGLTNAAKEENGERIVGMNTEDSEINEKFIRFDIIFYVRMKDGLAQVIINLEVQKDDPTKYKILNRATFYVCRLVSSQKERDFKGQNYDDIKRVFSIWICLNKDQNSMNHYHMTNDTVVGNETWKGNEEIINIVMIGISKELPEHTEEYELHRLIGALLSQELTESEKLNIIENEYDIPVSSDMRDEVSDMCNLSQGIVEQTTEKVTKEVTKEVTAEFIISMKENGFALEQIARVAKMTEEQVQKILDTHQPVLA
jgi:hypothetical protein